MYFKIFSRTPIAANSHQHFSFQNISHPFGCSSELVQGFLSAIIIQLCSQIVRIKVYNLFKL